MKHSQDQNSFAFVTTLSVGQIKDIFKECFEEFMRHARPNSHKLDGNQNEILSVRQAAKLTGLAISTIYEKTSKKLIPHFKKGKRVYFKHSELISWITMGKVKTDEELQGNAMDYLIKKGK